MIKNRFFKTTMGLFAELAIVARYDISNAGAQQSTYDNFIANALAGSLGVYFSDTKAALAAGDTALAANKNRSIFYAWKQGDGGVKRSTDIPIAGLLYDSIVYNAGTAQVRAVTYGGTFYAGQTLHTKIIETTGTHLPFPTFQYEVKIGAGGINQAVTDLAAAINAEKADNDPVVTAAGAANVLTITSKSKVRNFRVVYFVEATTAQPNDDSNISQVETVKQVYPIGDVASLKELERYDILNDGGIEYTGGQFSAAEMGQPVSNLDLTGATTYGFLLVKSTRTEKGVVRDFSNQAYIVIAVKTADVATIKGF
jgi:hypothetical protein